VTNSAAPGLLNAARILHAAGGPLFAQALLHAELAGVEWREEKNRLARMLAIALLGFACLLCTLLFGGALALAATWETPYRIPTLAALVILSGSGTFAGWRTFQAHAALGNQSFAASREELAADAALLEAGA
jgi:uncharacterized membrane protein YqjE